MTRTRLTTTALAATASMLAGGCGVNTSNQDKGVSQSGGQQAGKGKRNAVRGPALPQRPNGLVVIDGEQQGSATPVAVDQFNRQSQNTRATFRSTGENQAFADLCAGRVDVVDSAREISAAELTACRRRGIVLAPKIQVASDAVVVATRNESDVGGDCITLGDVGAIFRAGSTINNWNQLGFDNLPLHTTGPNAQSNVFSFFTQKVFGIPENSSLSAFRTGYAAQPTDNGVRFLVTNVKGVLRERQLGRLRFQRALRSDAQVRQRAINAAVTAADRRVLREIAATNRRDARLNIKVNAGQVAAANRRKDDLAKAQARAGVIRRFNARAIQTATRENNAALLGAEQSGTVGYFRFTYYEQYEDQLRPLEIDPTVPATASAGRQATGTQASVANATGTAAAGAATQTPRRPNCIFPSQTTITDQLYPLARPLLLYASIASRSRAEVQQFLQYYLLNAQRIATLTRLVPIPDQQRNDQLASLTGRQPAAAASTRQPGASASPSSSGVPGVASSAPGSG